MAVGLAAAAGQTHEELPPGDAPAGIQTFPSDPALRSRLQNALTQRDYASAERLLIEELDRDPKSRPALIALAGVLFLDGRYLNSATALKRAETISPLDERNRLLLALAYIAMDQGSWAQPELERLARDNPQNATYPYWLARLAYQNMDMPAAAAHAAKAVQLDPAFMKAYDQLGLCREALNEPDGAIEAYETAIRLNRQQRPPSPWPSANLGRLLLRLGRLEEAGTCLRESVEIAPRFPLARFRLGQLLDKEKKYDDAIRELNRACELDPTYAAPHFLLGKIHRIQGRLDASENEFKLFRKLRQQEDAKGIKRRE
jgi:tetratricopeptide (TPR) repeat protein